MFSVVRKRNLVGAFLAHRERDQHDNFLKFNPSAATLVKTRRVDPGHEVIRSCSTPLRIYTGRLSKEHSFVQDLSPQKTLSWTLETFYFFDRYHLLTV